MLTGGIKFFKTSKCLIGDGASITVSSGSAAKDFAIDKNPITFWQSVGSDDTTTETLTVTFASATIDRLLLLDHNFKDFNVQYWNGSTFVHFANVVGLDGALSNITETAFADDTAYYEFDAVTTTQIRIQVLKTQVVDDEKSISQILVTEELGTLNGFPQIKALTHSRNERKKEMLSGKFLVVKGIEAMSVEINFDNYPSGQNDDLDLVFSLIDYELPFLIWLCGGRRGTTYFRYTLRGFRLKDVYAVGIVADVKPAYYKNVYINPVDVALKLQEHV